MPLSITQWGLKHDDHAKHIASHVLNPFSNKLNFSLLVMNRGLFLHLRIDFYFAFQSHWKESEMKQSSWREKLLPRSNVSWDRETNNEVKKTLSYSSFLPLYRRVDKKIVSSITPRQQTKSTLSLYSIYQNVSQWMRVLVRSLCVCVVEVNMSVLVVSVSVCFCFCFRVSVWLYVCVFVHLCVCLSVCLYVYVSVYTSTYICIVMSICL